MFPGSSADLASDVVQPLSLSASLSFLFTDMAFLDRFDQARRSGFDAVEFMSPYETPPSDLARRVRDADVRVHLFNVPSGDWASGDRGQAVDPLRTESFRDGVRRALEYATELDVSTLNCLVGRRDSKLSWDTQFGCLIDNLRWAVDHIEPQGRSLLVEMVNPSDVPGFFLDSLDVLDRVLTDVGPQLGVVLDCYHVARVGEDVAASVLSRLDRVRHIQIADTPGRHQPGTGEIDYHAVIAAIAHSGYQGLIGLEYVPDGPPERWFSWVGDYGLRLSDR